ncbi:hypothetical protein BVRB_8g187010 [Beta vulgaris subsp. vulgaris]|nr:hypothetical protein BVRB_8g187010 [Beta vulgaris subsp. vulgaris]
MQEAFAGINAPVRWRSRVADEAQQQTKHARERRTTAAAPQGGEELQHRSPTRKRRGSGELKTPTNRGERNEWSWNFARDGVLYKHQLELDYKKKAALDKQLEYLLDQTERYSTMLAENLMGTSNACPSGQPPSIEEKHRDSQQKESDEKTVDGGSMELFTGKWLTVLV